MPEHLSDAAAALTQLPEALAEDVALTMRVAAALATSAPDNTAAAVLVTAYRARQANG
jgi:hypothetical protein